MHLIHVLQEKYEITQNWTWSLYSDITLNWDFKAGIMDIYMKGYAKEAFHKFQHSTTIRPHHSPHKWNPLTMAPQHHTCHTKSLNRPSYPHLKPTQCTKW